MQQKPLNALPALRKKSSMHVCGLKPTKELRPLFFYFSFTYLKPSIQSLPTRGQRMCPAARSPSEVLSYSSWDGGKSGKWTRELPGQKATQSAGDAGGRGCRAPGSGPGAGPPREEGLNSGGGGGGGPRVTILSEKGWGCGGLNLWLIVPSPLQEKKVGGRRGEQPQPSHFLPTTPYKR
jgi:hypothetical protein